MYEEAYDGRGRKVAFAWRHEKKLTVRGEGNPSLTVWGYNVYVEL